MIVLKHGIQSNIVLCGNLVVLDYHVVAETSMWSVPDVRSSGKGRETRPLDLDVMLINDFAANSTTECFRN